MAIKNSINSKQTCRNMKSFFNCTFFAILLALTLSVDAYGLSGISFMYWTDPDHFELEYGQTYTSAQTSFIKSGSLSVSEDGKTLTFDNLHLEYDGSSTSDLLNIDIFHGYPEGSEVTIVLKGENTLKTTGYEDISCRGVNKLTITGEGSMTTSCDYIDISLSSGYSGHTNGVLVIDDTSVICKGGRYTVSSCSHVIVKNSHFEGKILHTDKLTMEGCSFIVPYNGWFDADNKYVIDENGRKVAYFIIGTEEEEIDIPSSVTFYGNTLMMGHTYTSEDFSEIKNGSISVSKNGKEVTLDQLEIEDNLSKGGPFKIYNTNMTVLLKGDNILRTHGNYIMELENNTTTITGDGTLTTSSKWYDFWISGCNVIIENTTLNCEGYVSFGNNMWAGDYILVKNSSFSGRYLLRIKSLTLINCEFAGSEDVRFYPDGDDYAQLKRPDGSSVSSFRIQPVGGDFSNVVSPLDLGTYAFGKGEDTKVNLTMKHEGEQPIENISYVIAYNGTEYPPKTAQLPEPFSQTGYDFTVPVIFPAREEAGEAEVMLTVTEVNGKTNTSKYPSAKGTVLISDNIPNRRVVVEEFTGTWCGWCTRGTVALNLLNEQYGDSIITIAVHSGDPMECEAYTLGSNSYPAARVNRGELTDPYYGNSDEALGIKSLIDQELQESPLVDIGVSATWNNESQQSILITTETKYLSVAESLDYGIAYVLLEDGMKGSESGWAQKNFYAGDSSEDPNLLSITQLPAQITDIEYDHVAVDAWDIKNGADVPFSQTGVAQEKVFMADISSNSLIQDKTRLSVVALLIDRNTGRIVNAAKTKVKQETADHIDIHLENDVDGSDVENVYNVNGQRINGIQKGLNIVKSAGGSVRKVMAR